MTICHLCFALCFIDLGMYVCKWARERGDVTQKSPKATLALLPPLSWTFSLYPIRCHTRTRRSKTEVIDSHTNELMLWHSDSSSLWPEIDPQTPATVWKPPFTTPQAATQHPIKHTTSQRQRRRKTAALIKSKTATCRWEIYQLILNVIFIEESNCYLLLHNQGQLHLHNFGHKTALWIYYGTIWPEQPGVKCLVQEHSCNDSSRGSNHQTFPNIVTSSYTTITEEEKQIKVHINIWGILRQNAPIAAYVESKTKTTASTLVKSYLFSNRIF